MPTPNDGESREDFVSRCIPVVLDDGTAKDRDQAVAICNSMWEDSKVDKHARFLGLVSLRTGSKESYGYGITTAERYATELLKLHQAGASVQLCCTPEQLIKDAREKLVYANVDMVREKELDTELLDDLPLNTLMTIQHVLTSDREDRDGDVLRSAGASLDPKAPLLWQHQHFLPIGKVVKTIEQTSNIVRVISVLLDINELTADIAKLVEADALRFSHGFRVLDYEERKDDSGEPTGGFDVKEFEILEASLVSVPSNIDAEIELYSRGKLESDMFKQHAKQHVELTKPTQLVVSANVKTVVDECDDKATVDIDGDCVISDKTGRVLSQRNIETIEEVVADLGELKGMELTRSAEALCDRCVSRLQSILESAKPTEEDEEKETEAEEQKSVLAIELADVVNFVLGADKQSLHKVKETLISLGEIERYDERARQFREFNDILS